MEEGGEEAGNANMLHVPVINKDTDIHPQAFTVWRGHLTNICIVHVHRPVSIEHVCEASYSGNRGSVIRSAGTSLWREVPVRTRSLSPYHLYFTLFF